VSDPWLAMGRFVAYAWRIALFGTLLFHAALQGIPEELPHRLEPRQRLRPTDCFHNPPR
jgi:hypothetical protein